MRAVLFLLAVATLVSIAQATLNPYDNFKAQTPVHLGQRQREVLLVSGVIDTRSADEFHQNQDYDAYKTKGGHAEDEIHMYMVHFKTPFSMHFVAQLKEVVAGIQISERDYIPMNTFLMEATEEQAHQVKDVEFVAWVGAFLPQQKLEPLLQGAGPVTLQTAVDEKSVLANTLIVSIAFGSADQMDTLRAQFESALIQQGLKVTITIDGDHLLSVVLENPEDIHVVADYLAHRPQVKYISVHSIFQPRMQWANGLVQSGLETKAGQIYSAAGLNGENMFITLGDTGIDMASCYFSGTTLEYDKENPSHRNVFYYDTTLGDRYESLVHGTFAAGQLVGYTAQTSPAGVDRFIGMLGKAKLIFVDMHKGNSNSLNVPADVTTALYNIGYSKNSQIHNYPWGSDRQSYTPTDLQTDTYTNAHRDFLPVFPSGNLGRYTQFSDIYKINSPGQSKNGLTVGNSLNAFDSFVSNPSSNTDEFYDQNAEQWHTNLCSDSLVYWNDVRWCGSLSAATPCTNLKPSVCANFRAPYKTSCCTAGYSYLQTRCCPQTMLNLIATNPKLYSPRSISGSTSSGPTFDGRLKPDVVAPGAYIYSAKSNPATCDSSGACTPGAASCGFNVFQGSSYSSTNAASAAAIVRQYYTSGKGLSVAPSTFLSNPSASLIKATLVNSGQQVFTHNTNDLQHFVAIAPLPNYEIGFGSIQLNKVLKLDNNAGYNLNVFDNQVFATTTDASWKNTAGLLPRRYCILVPAGATYVKATVVWTDAPAFQGSAVQAVNNIDFVIVDSNGFEYRSNFGTELDSHNNVEQVFITLPPAGNYTLIVHPTAIVTSNDVPPFALVITGQYSMSSACHTTCGFGCGLNGNCVNGTCICVLPYSGPDCTLTPCSPGCGATNGVQNGICDGEDGNCVCDRFWKGDDCLTPNPSGVGTDRIVYVEVEDDDVAPGVVAGIAIACFFGGLVLGAVVACYATVRYLLTRQKKRIAQFQQQLKSNRDGGKDLLDGDDSE